MGRIAVPTREGAFCPDLATADAFIFFEADEAGAGILRAVRLFPPPPPRAYPEWLHELGVRAVIAHGTGCLACGRLEEVGIALVAGTGGGPPELLVEEYVRGEPHSEGSTGSLRRRQTPLVAAARTEGYNHP